MSERAKKKSPQESEAEEQVKTAGSEINIMLKLLRKAAENSNSKSAYGQSLHLPYRQGLLY